MSARPVTPPTKVESLAKKQMMAATTSVTSSSISVSSQTQTRQQKTAATMTDEEKLALKRTRNRRASAKSRHQKLALIEHLMTEIEVLKDESQDLDAQNRFLRLRLAVILEENKIMLQRAQHRPLVKSGGLDVLIGQSLLTKRNSSVPQGPIESPLPKLDPLPLPPVFWTPQIIQGLPGIQELKYHDHLDHHT